MSTLRTGSMDHPPVEIDEPVDSIGVPDACPRCGQPMTSSVSGGGGMSMELVCLQCKSSVRTHPQVRT